MGTKTLSAMVLGALVIAGLIWAGCSEDSTTNSNNDPIVLGSGVDIELGLGFDTTTTSSGGLYLDNIDLDTMFVEEEEELVYDLGDPADKGGEPDNWDPSNPKNKNGEG